MKKLFTFPLGVPWSQSCMWFNTALAALAALDSFLAWITAAPRCCTVEMNSPWNFSGFSFWASTTNLDPLLVIEGGTDWGSYSLGGKIFDVSEVYVGILRRAVVTPNYDVLYALYGHTQTLGNLMNVRITLWSCDIAHWTSMWNFFGCRPEEQEKIKYIKNCWPETERGCGRGEWAQRNSSWGCWVHLPWQ